MSYINACTYIYIYAYMETSKNGTDEPICRAEIETQT